MQNIINYEVLEEVALLRLEKKVHEMIAQGWQPLGGVGYTGERYMQAMVVYQQGERQ